MDSAFQMLENFYILSKRYPQLFDYTAERVSKLDRLLESGIIYPLADRDENGCRVFIAHFHKLDTNSFSVQDEFAFGNLLVITSLEEEETQISGLVIIMDCQGISLQQCLSLSDMKCAIDYVQTSGAFRFKKALVINMPPFLKIIFDMAMVVMSPKLKSRIFFINDIDELQHHIPKSILPKELGGVRSEAEILNDFKKIWNERREKRHQIIHHQIDWSKVPKERIFSNNEQSESVGSFRKLEID